VLFLIHISRRSNNSNIYFYNFSSPCFWRVPGCRYVRQIRLHINKPPPYTATCHEFQQSVRHKRVTDKQIKRIYTNSRDKTMNVYLATDLSNEQALRNKLGNVGHTHSVIIQAISKNVSLT